MANVDIITHVIRQWYCFYIKKRGVIWNGKMYLSI